MDWQHKSRHLQIETLRYFDKFDYPLTKKEIMFWTSPVSPSSVPPLNSILSNRISHVRGGESGGVIQKDSYFFLKGRSNLINIRRQREKYSLLKWGVAYRYASLLVKLPFIQAIFVTGSLSMNNCKKNDDIDFMIVTQANTLWIVRFLANILFAKNRRYPNQKSASDKICINLWLDIKNLKLKTKNLYIAHEILQAKCIFDRGGIHKQFLKENSWVKEYLPRAYQEMNYELRSTNYAKFIIHNSIFIIQVLNNLMFGIQYLYMKPKMTSERVGLGYAFFHPGS